jgi:predicted NUDIX family NTP pyrophosphohydrolase
MAKTSAGILLFRRVQSTLEVFLVHPGGPLWRKRDRGAWSIPKGEIELEEDALETAVREFSEETGCRVEGSFIDLGSIRQKGGKIVFAWAVAGDCDASSIRSNTFRMEWPPRSGNLREFPEIDRAAWMGVEQAREKINIAQMEFIERLMTRLDSSREAVPDYPGNRTK